MGMAYVKLNLHAELGKLSQGKQTKAPVWLVAKFALDHLSQMESEIGRNRAVEGLERLYRL